MNRLDEGPQAFLAELMTTAEHCATRLGDVRAASFEGGAMGAMGQLPAAMAIERVPGCRRFAGVSAGAWIAAALALGIPMTRVAAQLLREDWTRWSGGSWASMIFRKMTKGHALPDKRNALIRKVFGSYADSRLRDLPLGGKELLIGAMKREPYGGEDEIVLSAKTAPTMTLLEALRASSAAPVAYPYEWSDAVHAWPVPLTDGGVTRNLLIPKEWEGLPRILGVRVENPEVAQVPVRQRKYRLWHDIAWLIAANRRTANRLHIPSWAWPQVVTVPVVHGYWDFKSETPRKSKERMMAGRRALVEYLFPESQRHDS